MMSAIDPRLLKFLATAKAAGLEVAGFEIGPRLIKVQMKVPAVRRQTDKFDAFIAAQKAKGSKPKGKGS